MTSRAHSRPWLDPALTAAVLAFGVAITLDPENADGTWVDSLVIPAVALPLLWRRTRPLAAAIALSAGVVVSGIPTFDQVRCGPVLLAALAILVTLALRSERGAAVAGLGAVLAGLVVLLFTDPLLDPGAVFVLVLCWGAWAAGRVARSRGRLADELARRSEDLARTREDTARMAVEIERLKVAAELDDVTRAPLEQMVGLAGDEDAGDEVFGQIERAGRASMAGVRDVLEDLRAEEPVLAPAPTLDRLGELLGDAVALEVEGPPRPLPPGVDLAACRVVQHALRAVGPDDARVRVRFGTDAVEVEVHGRASEGPAADAALVAAGTRAQALGGTVVADADGQGGTVVRGRLPLAHPR